ncbi:MAG: hypothetical protein SFU83_08745 [Meiothermus sp.]|nr:hypothetical protein [Meiothermus sp.]
MEHIRRLIARTERSLLERGNEALEGMNYRYGVAVLSALAFLVGVVFAIVQGA